MKKLEFNSIPRPLKWVQKKKKKNLSESEIMGGLIFTTSSTVIKNMGASITFPIRLRHENGPLLTN